ncbi:nucleolar protein 8-like [Sinocyclocheilus anshuiensis]|uniref:Nucleolar protein 8 n=1 Tax=Sinocyclocheilus anshuiensis TaxID=1608454 RepID=A0A671Q5B6_9TELE|nr:PREDICTED: nucleolar protein 8-like [Sinocyclocheilus anshuiensis]XP_016302401.1 PREDICTED: nucleolar protein 8-like [Sinocyclocheilus anshuiensis]
MKRLYIGGLGHTVSEKDLKDRFGKFGDVSDVEIITRKDENGAPLKTFGYININITDAEYKRCVGILNKSTWKGGTLLIQLAKESFLHRLAEERQQLVEKAKTPKIIPQEKLVDSFKVAGVENFHMKAAVPGTEIPGHKNWVVSKFGRVLPVVNLKYKGKDKVFKYDPSKHCHNIKRLETADDVTSVSKLTWEIKGGDDEISKKRRGEFPKQKPCPKRSKIDLSLFLSDLAQRNGMNAAATGNKNKVAIQQNGLSAVKTGKQKSVCVFDNDSDSEDEIRMLVAQEHLRNPKQTSTEDDDDNNLEVVGDDFVVKSNVFWGGVEQDDVKTSLLTSSKDDEEYDSADTDEILTRRKTQTQVESAPVTQDSPTESSKNKSSTESDDGSDEAYVDDDVSVDSDYEAMMGICYRLDLSLADLEQLAKKAEVISDDESVEEPKDEAKTSSAPPKKTGNNPEDILASLLGDDTPEKESKKKNQVNTVSLPAFIGTKDLFGGPEPSLKRVAQNIDGESPKRLKQDLKWKEQSISEDTSQPQSSNRLSQQKLSTLNIQTPSKKLFKASISEDDSSSEESESGNKDVFTSKTSSASQSVIPETKLKTVIYNNSNTPIKPNQTKTSRSSSSDSSSEESECSEEDDNEDSAGVLTSKTPSVAQSVKTISKTEMKTVSSNNSKTPVKPNQTKTSRSSSSDSSSEESESSEEEDNAKVSSSKMSPASQSAKPSPETKLKTSRCSNSVKPKQTKTSRSSSSDSSSEESESSEEEDNAKVLTSKTSLATQLARTISKTVSSNNSIKPKQTKTSRSSSSDSSSEESETSDDEKSRTQTKYSKPANSKNVQENVVSHQTVLHSTVIDAKKQLQDNQKRLAALEQRQKETEQQRKLIQGALSNVDAVKANKSKHIVFDSDDEEEEDETTSRPEQPPTILKKSLFEDDSGSNEDQQTSMLKEKKNNKPGGSKLFDSEDEDDGSEDDRFQIKPQFEGKAGQKLMKLQARFGTDSRFQVDSRFLESDDESEDQDEAAPEKDADKQLLEEKKKSLDILQSILNTNIQPQNSRKGTMFKDVSSLHYDPTQEEHTAFEAKTEEPKKESKAARRKKRIEAEKLPEVSKDVYFDISVDLKEVFGTSKENQDEKETVSWDKEAEDTEDIMKHMEVSFTSNVEAKEDSSGGFKFSFFGEDTAAEMTTKTDEYKIETVKGAKFSWQADPRFQDSSSDEEGVDEVEEDQSASSKITEEPTTSKKTFFFFYQNDERLKEGPGMFCRSVKLQDQREAWEQKRTSLREECRKKHRDAKRRQRPSLKT